MEFIPLTGMTLRTIFFAAFILGLVAVLYRDRNKMRRHTIIFYRRTEKGIEKIDKVAKKFPRFWKFYSNAGVATGILSIFGSLALIGFSIFQMIKTQSTASGPSLILPGLVAENQFNPGVSFIPIEYWVAGIGILMFVHEISHGIVARLEGFELNSVGWGVMGIIPFAFVEPKGEQMLPGAETGEKTGGHWEQGSWKSQVRVLCAGSFANYLTAAIFLLLTFGIASAVTQPSGLIYNAQDGFPADKAGMNNGTLEEINGIPIKSVEELERATTDIKPGDNLSIQSSEGNFTLTTVEKEGYGGGYIGIELYGQRTLIKDSYSEYSAGLEWLTSLLSTVAILNFFIGLFNMLPAKPLDGGLTVETLIKRFAGESYTRFLDSFSILVWATIIGSLVLSLIGV